MRCLLSGLVVSIAASTALAQAPEPKYPMVDVATVWEVDAKWPQKPEGMLWGAVPGIAVDKSDNIYAFTRTEAPVQVYSSDGKLLRTWGKGIKTPHL